MTLIKSVARRREYSWRARMLTQNWISLSKVLAMTLQSVASASLFVIRRAWSSVTLPSCAAWTTAFHLTPITLTSGFITWICSTASMVVVTMIKVTARWMWSLIRSTLLSVIVTIGTQARPICSVWRVKAAPIISLMTTTGSTIVTRVIRVSVRWASTCGITTSTTSPSMA